MISKLKITKPVGKNCPNLSEDVKAVAKRLVEIEKISQGMNNGTFDQRILDGIIATQRHWSQAPDGVISLGGRTQTFLEAWSIKPISPSAMLPGALRAAWDLVNPLLPAGSRCTSGYRSADKQREILHDFFLKQYRGEIIKKYTQEKYDLAKADLLANENQVLAMVRGVGQKIASPGTSKHQFGKAIDVGGGNELKQVEIIRLVAKANPTVLSGIVLKERNRCVHFELR